MIAQKMSFSFMMKFIIQGLGYISLFFVARYMGPEALGIIAFAWAYIALFQSFADLGFGTAHIKRVSEGKDLGICNGTYFSVKFVLNILMTLVVVGTIIFTKYILHKEFISHQHEIVLYIILLSNFIGNISMMFIITFSARKEVAKGNIAQLIGKIVLVSGKVTVAVAGLGIIMLAGANVISAIVVLCCYIYFFKGYPVKKPNKKYFKSYLQFAIPVMFIGFISKYAENLDKVMIQFFWSTEDVGIYSAAKSISMLFQSITPISAALIFPTISKYHAEGNFEAIRNLSKNAERYLSMILFPIVFFIIIFSKDICQIMLGSKFLLLAPNILIILSFLVLINAITQPYSSQIGGTNHIKLGAVLSVIILSVNILLNLVFIPREFFGTKLMGLGAVGAAYATLISAILGTILFRIFAYRITKSKPNLVIIIHFFAASIMAICLSFVKSFSNIVWFYLPFFAIIGLINYLFILIIFGEFGKQELNYFMGILNPIKLKEYAKNEISDGYIEK